MPTAFRKPEDFIVSLNINGLEGRMMRLPAKKRTKREFLFLYGSHSSLERWWGLAEQLSNFGNVIMPDFPGLGGMTPLYKIGRQPDIDSLADYLAAFIKLKYRNKKVSIVGMSLGFVIATRMLQRYPDLTKKVEVLVSIVGFAHREDLIFSKRKLFIYKNASRVFSRKWPSFLFRHIALNPFFIKLVYHRTVNAKEKFVGLSGDEFRRTMEMEIGLWHSNDIRTQFKNYLEMFSLDNTHIQVNLPVYHVAAKKDRYFNNVRVEEHMRRIFNDFEIFYSAAPNHAPTVIATAKEAEAFIPPLLRRILARKPKT
jgi:pimeloyl-ACP methyl ester carboxylesterase